MMRSALRLSWIELKLFTRDPMTVLFSLALPIVMLFVLGGVFGNEPSADEAGQMVYRGVGAMDYYVPAYLGLVVASVCLVSIPAHIAGDRERGVLKRFRASGVSVWDVAGSELAVALVVSAVSSIIMLIVASIAYDFALPQSALGVLGAFLAMVVGFAALGFFLGSVLPTARSAQAIGVLSWFVLLMLGGAGPPPEVLPEGMRIAGQLTPLWYAVRMAQQPWLGLDPGHAWLVFGGILVGSAILGLRLFRWE
jgi:ABC-2 type transport system permease protein